MNKSPLPVIDSSEVNTNIISVSELVVQAAIRASCYEDGMIPDLAYTDPIRFALENVASDVMFDEFGSSVEDTKSQAEHMLRWVHSMEVLKKHGGEAE